MPKINLPSEFHPVNCAIVGEITYSYAGQNAAGAAAPARIAVYDFGAPKVIPMFTLNTGIIDVRPFPESFLGALIFINAEGNDNGTHYATYGFREQFGVIRPIMKAPKIVGDLLTGDPLQSAFNFMKRKIKPETAPKPSPPVGERPQNPDELLPRVYAYLNQWMQDYLQQSGGGQTPHV